MHPSFIFYLALVNLLSLKSSCHSKILDFGLKGETFSLDWSCYECYSFIPQGGTLKVVFPPHWPLRAPFTHNLPGSLFLIRIYIFQPRIPQTDSLKLTSRKQETQLNISTNTYKSRNKRIAADSTFMIATTQTFILCSRTGTFPQSCTCLSLTRLHIHNWPISTLPSAPPQLCFSIVDSAMSPPTVDILPAYLTGEPAYQQIIHC